MADMNTEINEQLKRLADIILHMGEPRSPADLIKILIDQ